MKKIISNVIKCLITMISCIGSLSAQQPQKIDSADAADELRGDGAMLVRISEIEVYPEYLDEYLSFALTVGAISVSEEPGVIAIFPMVTQHDSCQIRILEIYADQKAYLHHIGTDHFQTYKQGTIHMVKRLDLIDMTPMNPSAMPDIFRKLNLGNGQ